MLSDRFVTLLQLAICSVVALSIAWKVGFFHVPTRADIDQKPPTLVQVACAFFIYLATLIVLVPTIADGWVVSTERAQDVDRVLSDPSVDGWLNFLGVCLALPLLVIYSLMCGSTIWEKRQLTGRERWWNIGLGILTWLVAFPIVTLVAEGVKDLMGIFFQTPPLDQVAVRHLKSTFGDIPLLVASTVNIILLVPIVEELLFRGFLQSWLRTKLPRGKTILLSAFLFTLVHFSISQGLANTELLAGLFLLSCFFGYLYERQATLWPSIALHCTFNAVSVTLIMLGISAE